MGGFSRPPSRQREYLPPPPRDDDRYDNRFDDRRAPGRRDVRSRSRSVRRMSQNQQWAGNIPKGRHKITIENLPDDMTWLELKEIGRDYGPSLTFSRTYQRGRVNYGLLEFSDGRDANTAIKEFDGRKIDGCRETLIA